MLALKGKEDFMTNNYEKLSKRNNLLDFIKFVAILLVIITHESWNKSQKNSFIFPYIIDMAVPFFLLISSYLRTAKIDKQGLRKTFCTDKIIKTFVKLLLSYFIVITIELLTIILINKFSGNNGLINYTSIKSLFIWTITGGSGPGSYYIPILIQLIPYFLIIYFLFKKNITAGLITSFFINIVYEVLVYLTNFNPQLYRILIFRYTLLIGFGIYLYLKKKSEKHNNFFEYIMLIIGLIYVTSNHYFVHFPLFQDWKSTSMLCAPYAYASLYFLMKYFSKMKYTFFCQIGKASYHIYLIQMFYYAFRKFIISKFITINSVFITLPISIILCIGFGYLFYKIELPIREKLINFINIKTNKTTIKK